MSSPRALIQILVSGSQILGKAFYEAGRQAVKNAKHNPQGAIGADAAGVGTANSGSPSDHLTRQHRITLDEAQLILNVKRGDPVESILKNYQHLFKANSPAPKPEKPPTGKAPPAPAHSHYLQSKVFRAKERIDAEFKLAEAPTEAPVEPLQTPNTPGTPPNPPPQ